jgi:phosphopantothenoylcysteine decarboxylase / phosphopantothenate---cysteine ligase
MELSGKKIILSVTGGIAAYKSVTLLRLLTKEGAEVQVLMTPTARQFVTPVTFSALSGKTVLSDFFDAGGGDWNSHVDLGVEADLMIIAPATATTMGKLANGIADNLVVATYLSARCPVVVVPAMDMDMYAHPSTQRNLDILASYGNHIVQPAEGELASGLSGKGRMQEPEVILQYIQSLQADEKKKS